MSPYSEYKKSTSDTASIYSKPRHAMISKGIVKINNEQENLRVKAGPSYIFLIALIVLFCCVSTTEAVTNERKKSPNFKKAIELGFEDYNYVALIYSVIEKLGVEKAKMYLYIVGNDAEMQYYLFQKLDQYLVYSGAIGNHVSRQIIVIPLQGEYIQKRVPLPGDYYRLLGTVELSGSDGFAGQFPLFQRIMTAQEAIGYGNPPADVGCRQMIVGTWSYDGKYGTEQHAFKSNGVFNSIQFTRPITGKWSIKDNFLIMTTRRDGQSATLKSKIIKLTNDTLVMHSLNQEKTYVKKGVK